MDCRETQTLLTAFHDGELPAAERARVEEHLRGCPGCAALLADLARADRAVGVPDPGPAYWDRFNERVRDRVGREADGPGVAVLRPKGGWVRQQLRYLVPAAAAAALLLIVVRFAGIHPGAPPPTAPPSSSAPAAPASEEKRMAKAGPESRAQKKEGTAAADRRVPPPAPAGKQGAARTREERDRLDDRPLPAGNGEASRDRAAAPAAVGIPSPPPVTTFRGAPAGSPPAPAADDRGGYGAGDAPGPVAPPERMPREVQGERKKTEEYSARMEPQAAGKTSPAGLIRAGAVPSPGAPCGPARSLAERGRLREAEAAQRECLAGDLDAPSREKGLVFLAELLDRQARFGEADAVIAEVDRRFPRSVPLDLYRRQRPIIQKEPGTVPVTR